MLGHFFEIMHAALMAGRYTVREKNIVSFFNRPNDAGLLPQREFNTCRAVNGPALRIG